jgi:hypothetical protein
MVLVTACVVAMPGWAVYTSAGRGAPGERGVVSRLAGRVRAAVSAWTGGTVASAGARLRVVSAAGHVESPVVPVHSLESGVDRVEELIGQLRRRFQELGAEHLLLRFEAGARDADPGGYRFTCRMPIPENPVYERPFEALAADPVSAMLQVLRDVEVWQAGDRVGSTPSRGPRRAAGLRR